MWTCPECNRVFKVKNQWHSCVIVREDDLFTNKPSSVKEIYTKLLEGCQEFSTIEIDTTKSCIYFVDSNRYLVVKPQKTGLIIEFVLNRNVDVFPVIKIIEIAKFRFAHRVMLESSDALNEEVMSWIEEAYRILKPD